MPFVRVGCMTKKSAYAAAGVDIDSKMQLIRRVKTLARQTATAGVLSEIGSFGGFHRSPGKDHVLVSSTDGVGTKLQVAAMANHHATVGQDIVNHCVNDILVHGAIPLFFLDYVGMGHLDPAVFMQLISGLSKACRANKCALIGGETAEMPGLYPNNSYDLVGTIIGSVPRRQLITGKKIRSGQAVIGLASSGLHTNGYSLARKIIFDQAGLKIHDRLPGTRQTVAQALLAVHRSYLQPIQTLRRQVPIFGMAHITGGGFPDNIRRILPDKITAVIDHSAWPVPPLFRYLQEAGHVNRDEMYRVFNMGVGMTVVIPAAAVGTALTILRRCRTRAWHIGHTIAGSKAVELL